MKIMRIEAVWGSFKEAKKEAKGKIYVASDLSSRTGKSLSMYNETNWNERQKKQWKKTFACLTI